MSGSDTESWPPRACSLAMCREEREELRAEGIVMETMMAADMAAFREESGQLATAWSRRAQVIT